MKIYSLHRTQKLPITQEEAWDFLSDPHNLGRITPEGMDFRILSGADRPMFAGQIIEYTVKPLAGISTKWVTEITHCVNCKERGMIEIVIGFKYIAPFKN